jgi:hypothetical protein
MQLGSVDQIYTPLLVITYAEREVSSVKAGSAIGVNPLVSNPSLTKGLSCLRFLLL